jgi:hypothetical protein
MSRVTAKAKIQVTVEVTAGIWGPDCNVEQLLRQASKEGIEQVQRAMSKADQTYQIIGEPKVLGILTELE